MYGKYLTLLDFMTLSKSVEERRGLLTVYTRDEDFMKFIILICKNIVSVTVPLTKKQKFQIKAHKQTIYDLSKSRYSGRSKLIRSGGGFLTVLFPVIKEMFEDIRNDSVEELEDV